MSRLPSTSFMSSYTYAARETRLYFDLREAIGGLCSDTLIIPLVVAIASLGTVFLQLCVAWVVSFGSTHAEAHSDEEDSTGSSLGLAGKFKRCVQSRGGLVIFRYQLARALGGLTLLALTSISTQNQHVPENLLFHQVGSGNSREHYNAPQRTRMIHLSFCAVYLYTTLLSFLATFGSRRWSQVAKGHVNIIYLTTFSVFAYRDLYPFMTFDILPLDIIDGLILWVKIAVLFVVGVLIPLMTPRKYVPLDPKNPMEPNPEQTASILSKITYSFLNSIVSLAYRVPHLAHDQLPALADYDYVENLKSKSFKYFSLSAKSKQRHVFWGLMRTFQFEYILAGFLLVLMTPSTFVSPFALNRLLSYLEADYQRATIQPWVWITSLFLGPLATSVFYQGFNFSIARTVVRCEAIITQLVFEHSLRIRLKDETETGEEVMQTDPPTLEAESSSENTMLPTAGTGEGGFSIANEVGVVSTPSERAVGAAPPSESAPSRDLAKEKRILKEDDISPSASNIIGHINNLVTTDLGNIVDARDFMFVIVFIPLQLIACIAFLYWILGWSAFVGLFVLICMIPIPGYVAKNIQLVQQRRLKETDARVETVTEAMNMLRMIKLFGWEMQMQDKIFEKREDELVWLWKNELLELVNNNINYAIPIFVMVSTYFTYECVFWLETFPIILKVVSTVIMKQALKPSTVFSSMTVFDLLREQFFTGFFMFSRMIVGKVSLDRINDFLENTELLDACASITLPPAQARTEDERIGFSESSFAWSTEFDGSLHWSRKPGLSTDGNSRQSRFATVNRHYDNF